MNRDRIAGAAETLAGRATSATGEALNNGQIVARGHGHQLSGKRRNISGSIRDFFGIERKLPLSTNGLKENFMNKDEIKGGVRYVKGKVEKGVGDVTTDTKWQADGIIDQVAGAAQNLYGRAKETVGDMVDGAPDAIAGAGERAHDVASRGRTLANHQVKDNPWALVAAAGIVGYALSWLLHGRRD